MPIYEYTCGTCGHRFEHLARRRSETPPACPECGAKKVVKELSVFSAFAAPDSRPASCPDGSCKSAPCAGGACPLAGPGGRPSG